MLSELARRLSEHVEQLSAEWAQRLLLHLDPLVHKNSPALEALAWVNTWYLDDHLARLGERRVEAAVRENFERHLRLLRSQRNSPPERRLTLAQLYGSLEVATSLLAEWAQRLFADEPRLPALLAAISRLSLHLGQSVSQAFHEVRSEEVQEALRISSALLETSVELNTRSASVAAVVSHLSEMIARKLQCDRSLTFLWDSGNGGYVPADGHGITPSELGELKQLCFRPGDLPVMENLLRGETVSGTSDDGRVARESMERYHSQTYALAPMVGTDRSPLGILAAYRTERQLFGAADLRILEGMAQNAALALENAQLVEQLEAASRLKGEFINSMSHEMRTPLNVIFGYLEMLSDQLSVAPESRVAIERIRNNAGHLVKLVNNLLDIGRIDAGRMPINVETFHVQNVFDDLHQLFAPVAQSRGISFAFKLEGDPGHLTTDRLKLLEILNHLLSNAFKFTDEGRVDVRACVQPGAERVRFEVADTGVGIEPECVSSAFDLFRQGSKGERGGTGLGLYVVKRLTDLLCGEVEVDSAPGRGSSFRVQIPRVLAA